MTRKHTRRAFLRRTARTVAIGVAAPAIARSGALAAQETPAANDRVGIGHIGIGGMGSGHLGHYLRNSKYQTVAVCDVDASYRERAAKRAGRPVGQHVDYRELLDRKDVDAVVIATPDHWHALCAVHACEAGKDVYCEKPLSLTIWEGQKMVEAVRRYGRVFQTGSQQRSGREFLKACELVRNGRIGKVKEVRVNVWGSSVPCHVPAQDVPAGLDWNRWLGPAPVRPFNSAIHPKSWRRYREFSGGTMTDWGAHHLDIAQWGLGRDGSGPVEFQPPTGDGEWVTMKYDDGVVVKCGRVGSRGVLFIGESGKVHVARGFFESDPVEIGKEPLTSSDLRLYASPGHKQDWERSIVTRKRPICDVEIGFRSVTLCHLANIAIWTGRTIRWDPATQEIVDDEQAARWVRRSMRAPFIL